MKKWIYAIALLYAAAVCSCAGYDDSALQNRVGNLESEVRHLKELCSQMNTNISAMQSIVNALQNNDYVTGVAPVVKNGVEIGYTIMFSKSSSITIYHGSDGKDGVDGKDGRDGTDGYTPIIGVQKDSDGVYYWTLDGSWLKDISGNRIKAIGTDGKDGLNGGVDGKDGEDGKDGVDGKDGADGITPRLKIENDWWYISYDNGNTWTKLSKATGENGKDGKDGADGNDGVDGKDGVSGGDSFFKSVDCTDKDYVVFTLADGSQFKLPTWYAYETLRTQCNRMNPNIASLQSLVSSLENNDHITSCTPYMENGVQTGYVIAFAKSASIIVYNGKDGAAGKDGQDGSDGKDGSSPVVGVKKDSDGVYWWTLNGEWLTDASGNRVKAQGSDGTDGAPGTPGADGKPGADGRDGADGVTPKLKIEDGFWFVSLDNGQTYSQLGKATGADGKDGDSFFSSVTDSETKVTFVLANGTVFEVPKESGLDIVFQDSGAIRFSLGSSYRIAYTLVGSDAQTSIELLCQDGLKATLEKTDEMTGFVAVTTPYTIVERSTVIVLVSDGRGKTMMKALNFVYDGSSDGEKGTLIITTAEPLKVGAAGGTVNVPIQTNLSYRVQIDASVAEWLTLQETVVVKSLREETLCFEAAANSGAQRRAFVHLINLADESIAQTFCITQDADQTALAETLSFVDPVFEKIAVTVCDLDGDGKVSRAEALNIETLNVSGKGISDLTGIEWFTNLRVLNCSGNASLLSLNVLNNTALEELNCSGCKKLSALDVSKHVALRSLNCSSCSLKKLDLSNNSALTMLNCSENSMTSLDLSHNPEVMDVNCSGNHAYWTTTATNRIRSLNLSGCSKLLTLNCAYQLLASLNISDCIALTELESRTNVLLGIDLSHNIKLRKLDCADNKISSLNLSHNSSLATYNISNNPLKDINVGSVLSSLDFVTGGSYTEPTELKISATKLKSLFLNRNGAQDAKITSIDFSNCTSLESATIYLSTLPEIDFSPCPSFNSLEIYSLQLQTLNFSRNANLKSIYCNGCINLKDVILPDSESFTSGTFLGCTQLSDISFANTPNLRYLEFEKCPSLKSLDLSNNLSLQKLNLSQCKSLNYLNLGANPYLKTLIVSFCGPNCNIEGLKVEKLSYSSNNYTTTNNLVVKNLPALIELQVSNCNMKTIDLSGNPHLKKLTLSGTALENLDLSNNPEVETVSCFSIMMQSLNVTRCPLLNTLDCKNNYYETLDVSGNPLLTTLNCSGMTTLKTLYLDQSQRIRYITYDRSTSYIPEQTILEYK